jgi:hypothetical protein
MALNKTDGTLYIGTTVETKGFNDGVKQTEAAAERASRSVLSRFRGVGDKLKLFFKGVLGIVMGILGFISVGILFGNELMEKLLRGIDKTSGYYKLLMQTKSEFDRLKGSIFALFATIMQIGLPVLAQVMNWLTGILDKANQLLGALAGQKTVMKAIVKSTQDQKKAAEGTLAAFDQINILKKQEQEQIDNNPITFQEVPVTQEAVTNAQKIKDEIKQIKDMWTDIKQGNWGGFWDKFLDYIYWDNWKAYFKGLWTTIVNFSKEKWQEFLDFIYWENWKDFFTVDNWKQMWGNFVGYLKTKWQEFKDWIYLDDWKAFFIEKWQGALEWLKTAWDNMKNSAATAWNSVKDTAKGAWDWVVNVWKGARDWFSGLWAGIKDVFRWAINGIIDFLNGLIRAMVSGINAVIGALNTLQVAIPEWVPIFGGQSWGVNLSPVSAPQIPRLATGAVIPPNAQFLAVLGDQKNGRNIEAPESLIRQIIQEEMGGVAGNLTVNMPVYLDGEQVYRNQQRVSLRHGKSLIAGGTV